MVAIFVGPDVLTEKHERNCKTARRYERNCLIQARAVSPTKTVKLEPFKK